MRTISAPGLASRLWRSFAFKFILLLIIFLTVPIILLVQFVSADSQRNEILLASVRDQGRLIAAGLLPVLAGAEAAKDPAALGSALSRLAGDAVNAKVLFRPKSEDREQRFYFVASAPMVSGDYLESERAELARIGVFQHLDESCQTDFQSAIRYTNPRGEEEFLSSITPVNLDSGCWVVVTSHSKADFPAAAVSSPYWASPRILVALVFYALMAVIIASLLSGLWRGLRRFGAQAHTIRVGGAPASFAERNNIPELDDVAREFDRLVQTLRASADGMRQAAEENAHALKAPLAVIAQSIEPLRRSAPADDSRAQRSLHMIDRSIEKLDALVSAAKRMDEATAELLDPPRDVVDLSRLINRISDEYRLSLAGRRVALRARVVDGAVVVGGEEMLETVAENLLDNAASFAPPGSEILLSLAVTDYTVRITVEDEGPGVAPQDLERIFERYVSIRESGRESGRVTPEAAYERGHFGIGLWIVRRNVEAMGGKIEAQNRGSAGLAVTVDLPRAT